MELTLEQANTMIRERFAEYPKLGAVGSSSMFEPSLSQILDFEGVDQALLPLIAHEVRVVLALYAPLSELAPNIAESTKLPLERSTSLVTLIKSTLLDPVLDDLEGYDVLWKREQAASAPTASADSAENAAKPLTREELMRALERKQDEGSTVDAMRQKLEQAAQQRTVGYDAVKKNDETNPST